MVAVPLRWPRKRVARSDFWIEPKKILTSSIELYNAGISAESFRVVLFFIILSILLQLDKKQRFHSKDSFSFIVMLAHNPWREIHMTASPSALRSLAKRTCRMVFWKPEHPTLPHYSKGWASDKAARNTYALHERESGGQKRSVAFSRRIEKSSIGKIKTIQGSGSSTRNLVLWIRTQGWLIFNGLGFTKLPAPWSIWLKIYTTLELNEKRKNEFTMPKSADHWLDWIG